MRNRMLTRILVSLTLCTVFLAIPMSNAYAMPFNAAVNYTAGTNPISVAIGDFNRDGQADLAVANDGSNDVSILLGHGDGTFAAAANYLVGTRAFSVAVGDFNMDGKSDLAVANWDNDNVSNVTILRGDGLGAFSSAANYRVGIHPSFVTVDDFNSDGKPDLAVANFTDCDVSILLGHGDGTFDDAVDYPVGNNPWSVDTGDFNGDGKADMAVSNALSDNISILLGHGDGTFDVAENYTVGINPRSIAASDFNRDGKTDLAVANQSSDNVSILLGHGDGTFAAAVNYSTGTWPVSVAVGDFNGDGKADLATANYNGGNISILLGNGDGTFNSAVNYEVGTGPHSVAVGDFNMDEAPDLAVANYGSACVSVLLNTPKQPTVTAVNPAYGNQGQCPMTVIIRGTHLIGTTAISFGTGININSFAVNSATQITATICIGAGATPGTRNVSVTTHGGTGTLKGEGFTVDSLLSHLLTTSALSSHGSSMAAPTIPAPPVSLPNIQIQSASLSASKVAPGTPVTVTANIANRGTVNGSIRLKLYVNGEEDSSQGVTVESGGNRPVYFTVSRSQPGTYTVYIGGTQAGRFMVDDAIDPNMILFISSALIAVSLIIGMVYIMRRRDYGY